MVSHLYLLSDLLHNSGSSRNHASTFRTHIEAKLPEAFKVMGKAHQGITGRLSAKAMEIRVEKVLAAWDRWGVFTSRFLDQLRCNFHNTDVATKSKGPEAKKAKIGDDVVVSVEKSSATRPQLASASNVSGNLMKKPLSQETHESESMNTDSKLDGEAFDPDNF